MYEAKFNKYISKSHSRYAETAEILDSISPISDSEGRYHAGTPVHYEDGQLYIEDSDAHTIAIGPTGCKKTRTLVITTVESIIAAGESAVINDPKMEIFQKTSGFASAKGYDIKVLNLRNPSASNGWNPLAQAYRYYKQNNFDAAYQCVDDFVIYVISPVLEKTVDRYWGDTTYVFLVALILILMDSVPQEYFNIANLIQLCYEKNSGILKEILQQMDQSTPAAYGLHTVLDLEADKTKSCIYSTLLSALAPFSRNKSLLNLLCKNDIDIVSAVKKPTLIYVVYPDERASLNFLVNSFFTQCYETLVSLCAHFQNDTLPIRTNFVIDEFSNLPMIENFDNRISEARSKNIRYFLYCQSYSQLQNKYKEHAETILSNCSNWVMFSSREIGFLNRISEICGREIDYNGMEHYLISPCEMQHLKKFKNGAEALILRAGEYPYISMLPDYAFLQIFPHLPAVKIQPQYLQSYSYISFEEWYNKISSSINGFSFPFPANCSYKRERKNRRKNPLSNPEILSPDIQKELEAKFDELFGALDDTDSN